MAKAATTIVPALKLLMSPDGYRPQGVCVLAGDDAYIKHEARIALTRTLLGESGDNLGAEILEGRSAGLRDVLDALSERSLFGGEMRVVVIEDADTFVKQYANNSKHSLKNCPAKPRNGLVTRY